jgi:hypothetical protein
MYLSKKNVSHPERYWREWIDPSSPEGARLLSDLEQEVIEEEELAFFLRHYREFL